MSLIHIHVLACVHVPISIKHVTIQTNVTLVFKCTRQFRSYYIIAYTWLKLIMSFDVHDSVNYKMLMS